MSVSVLGLAVGALAAAATWNAGSLAAEPDAPSRRPQVVVQPLRVTRGAGQRSTEKVAVEREPRDLSSLRRVRQTLAFTRDRLGSLDSQRVRVWRSEDFAPAADFAAAGAANLVALVGGDLFASGDEGCYWLSSKDTRPRRLGPLPGEGDAVLLPHPRRASRLSMQRGPSTSLQRFDLGRASVWALWARAPRPLGGWDSRAVLRLRDTSLVYTTVRGLSVVRPSGRVRRVPLEELDPASVWALLPDSSTRRVWVVAQGRAALMDVRGAARVVRSLELEPEVVAVVGAGGYLAALALDGGTSSVEDRLRLDVYGEGEARWSLRFADAARRQESSPGEASLGESAGFSPEVVIAPRRQLVAVRGRTLQVFDYQRGERRLSVSTDASARRASF